MKVKIPHKYTKTEALSRVKNALTEAKPQLQGKATIEEERWDGDTLHFAFTANGNKISGTLQVLDNAFDLYAKLPLLFRVFEGRIQKMIEEQGKQMLG